MGAQAERFCNDVVQLVGTRCAEQSRFGIALSGGPDSIALLLLAQRAFPGRAYAATVNHGLRVEAEAEAAFCAKLCNDIGVPHQILTVASPIQGNVQTGARVARYALLNEWAANNDIDYIATAHHSDDQLETIIMRLRRGAGLSGLSGIRARTGKVIRPLLGWKHAELVDIVANAGIIAIDDPSNGNDDFDRVRLRKELANLSPDMTQWLDAQAFSRSARYLADADAALTWVTAKYLDSIVQHRADEAEVAPEFTSLPHELQRRILFSCFRRMEPALQIKGDALENFLDAMLRYKNAMLGDWLAVAKKPQGSGWAISRSPPRR